jgi:hypothetical protein
MCLKTVVKILTILSYIVVWILTGPGTSFSSPQKSGEEKWISYATDEDNTEYFYNAKKIQHMPGNSVKVWVKAVYPEKKSKYLEAELLWEIDCSKKSMRGITAKAKLKDGQPVDLTKPSSWSNIPAGSTAEALYELVCTREKSK